MRLKDIDVFIEDRFSIVMDAETGSAYLSIPVRNPYVEYSEYYSLPDKSWALKPAEHIEQLRTFAQECRLHKVNNQLLQKPGRLRGDPINPEQ